VDQDRLSDLQGELRYLLNHWDPIGVYDEALDFPPDEYDCMIGPLLSRLDQGQAIAEISEYLWFELEDHFGLDPTPYDSDRFASTVVAWFRSHKP
jgi:hypothetical protein